MNRIVSSLVVAGISALAISGTAQAAMFSHSVSAAVQAVDSGNYTLQRIDALDDDKADRLAISTTGNADAVQQAVRSNPALLNDLASRNVQVGNIVDARPAANGGVTFYLR